jgi:iron complex transport system ATP-binding protein
VSELSDGERQRVTIACALAQEPSVMILDEITGFLDLPRRIDIIRLLRNVAHDTGCAVLRSTHDLDLALRTADRIWLMSKGQPLCGALPETLVLEGAFQAAFALDDVAFDEESGSFRIRHPRRRPVALTGHGPAMLWTTRALERYGFYPAAVEDRVDLAVNVSDGPEGRRWHVALGGIRREHRRLEDLIQALQADANSTSSARPR